MRKQKKEDTGFSPLFLLVVLGPIVVALIVGIYSFIKDFLAWSAGRGGNFFQFIWFKLGGLPGALFVVGLLMVPVLLVKYITSKEDDRQREVAKGVPLRATVVRVGWSGASTMPGHNLTFSLALEFEYQGQIRMGTLCLSFLQGPRCGPGIR